MNLPDGCRICCQCKREEKLRWIIRTLHPRFEKDVPRVPQRVVETLEGDGTGVAGRGEHLNDADVPVLQQDLPLKWLPLLVVVEDQSLHGIGSPLDEIDAIDEICEIDGKVLPLDEIDVAAVLKLSCL